MKSIRWNAAAVVAILIATIPVASAAEEQAPLEKECEYGITLALAGQDAAAESVFVSLLSHAPKDARALNNLGNVHLLRGNLDVALVFYSRALEADSTDAGIMLNQGTALMLEGEDDLAQARATEGVRRAGGTKQAALLLGLHDEGSGEEASRGAERAYVNKDEILSLLRAAARSVPADSSHAVTPPAGEPGAKSKKRSPTWRSAGARGGEGDAATVVYWKH